METSNKILIAIVTIVVLSLGGFIIIKEMENSKRQTAIEENIVLQKQLADNITRSLNQYASKKDMEEFAKQSNINLEVIKDDLKKINASVTAINQVSVNSNGYTGSNINSTNTTKNLDKITSVETVDCNGKKINCPDPNGYLSNRQVLTLTERFGNTEVPIGSTGFSAWKEKPWDVNILSRQYKLSTVVGTDENQRQFFYNKFSINVDGKDYPVNIDKAETKQQYPESKMYWWNPRIHMTTGASINFSDIPIKGSGFVGATLGIMSYGKFKNSPDISILQLGLGYQTETQKPSIIVNPVSFNIKGLLPDGLINNTFIGPSLQLDSSGKIFGGIGISVSF